MHLYLPKFKFILTACNVVLLLELNSLNCSISTQHPAKRNVCQRIKIFTYSVVVEEDPETVPVLPYAPSYQQRF